MKDKTDFEVGDIVEHERGRIGRVINTNYNDAPEVEVEWFGRHKDTKHPRTSVKYLEIIDRPGEK